jgi:1-acyl-sn-glycerol-3-phosphate acyltransferase
MMYIRAVFRLLMIVVSAAFVAPWQIFGSFVYPPLGRRIPLYYYGFLLRLVGMRVTVSGVEPTKEPALVVANHGSYLDILILGSLVQGCFVAKVEMANWPLFGWMARACRTIFVDRSRRANAPGHRDQMLKKLASGDSVIFFPEGTSSDGNKVDPFKSTLFSAAEHDHHQDTQGPIIQPASIAYTGIHGLPLGRRQRSLLAWYGDSTLVPHIWELVKTGVTEAQVEFHPTMRIEDYPSRRELSRDCHRVVSNGLANLLAGPMPSV